MKIKRLEVWDKTTSPLFLFLNNATLSEDIHNETNLVLTESDPFIQTINIIVH